MKGINTKYLDGIRFLLALWVAVGHFVKYMGDYSILKISIIGAFLLNNSPAVDGFMVITGFLMMYHYLLRSNVEDPTKKSTFFKFWLRRLFRLYPLYIFAILAAYFLYDQIFELVHKNYFYFTGKVANFSTSFDGNPSPGFIDLFSHLTFTHGLIPLKSTSILGPAWSLSLEMQFYILFPFIFLLIFRNQKVITARLTAITVFSMIIAYLTPKLLGTWETPGILMYFGGPSLLPYKFHFFILGMIMACVLLKKASFVHLGIWTLVVLPFENLLSQLTVISIISLVFHDQVREVLDYRINWFLDGVKKILSNRLSNFGADISYSLYLLHMIIIPFVVGLTINLNLGSKVITAAVSLFSFLTINILISWILFNTIEKPFINVGKNLIKKYSTKSDNKNRHFAG